MRIAMIGQKGVPTMYGGIERHVEDLSIELVKKGHEVLVYARTWYSPRWIKKYHGIQIVHTPTIHTKHLDAITHTITSTIHALFAKPDIIHYHGIGPSLLSWIPRIFLPKTKVVVTFHCIDRYHKKWGFFAKLILRLGERTACHFPHETIAVSKTIQSYCLNEYGKTTLFLPNGMSENTAINNSLLREWGVEPDQYILMVTRLVEHKGAHYLINAWQVARYENPELLKNYKLVIVGDSSFTDSYVKKLHTMAQGDSSIIFTGWLNGPMLTTLYANTALFVHPSENEGLPMTVLRAMSCGRPVLVSDIPEHKEVITDSRFCFANTNVTSLSNKIISLLQDKELLSSSGEANKKIVEMNYNWTNIVKETIELYQKGGNFGIAKLSAQIEL